MTELARLLHISTNSVFRIMKRLVARGYVEEDPETGAYRLGTGFFSLGMQLSRRFDLRHAARPHLETLTGKILETSQIHIADSDCAVVLDVVTPPLDYYLQVTPGARLDLHCNAFGKAILAFLPREEAMKRLPTPLAARTRNTITNRKQLMEELAKVRETGLTYDWEEYLPGVFCIGAPVFDVEGKVVAGAGMTGLAARFDGTRRAELETLVLETARAISRDIGYRGSFFESKVPGHA